jgi:transcription elongation factor Elf1
MQAGAGIIDATAPAPAARLSVNCVQVEAVLIWFHCPRCEIELSGFLADPRGLQGVVCQMCGAEFDIPANASIVIV